MKNVFKEIKEGKSVYSKTLILSKQLFVNLIELWGFFNKRTLKIAQCKLGGGNR